jgi:hypothetical protein
MWIVKSGVRVLIHDGTLPFWRSEGWEPDVNSDSIGDETAAALAEPDGTAPAPIDDTPGPGVSTRRARIDHVHTGQKLAAIAGPSGGLTVDAEARTAINAILTVLTAHGLTL